MKISECCAVFFVMIVGLGCSEPADQSVTAGITIPTRPNSTLNQPKVFECPATASDKTPFVLDDTPGYRRFCESYQKHSAEIEKIEKEIEAIRARADAPEPTQPDLATLALEREKRFGLSYRHSRILKACLEWRLNTPATALTLDELKKSFNAAEQKQSECTTLMERYIAGTEATRRTEFPDITADQAQVQAQRKVIQLAYARNLAEVITRTESYSTIFFCSDMRRSLQFCQHARFQLAGALKELLKDSHLKPQDVLAVLTTAQITKAHRRGLTEAFAEWQAETNAIQKKALRSALCDDYFDAIIHDQATLTEQMATKLKCGENF